MSEIITNTLEINVETWSDPGEYPNAVAGGPLSSYDYIECVDGEVVISLNDEDLAEFLHVQKLDKLYGVASTFVQEFINEIIAPKVPDEVVCTKWGYELSGNNVVLTIEEFECVENYNSRDDY